MARRLQKARRLAVVAGHVEIMLDVGQIRAKRLNGDEAIMADDLLLQPLEHIRQWLYQHCMLQEVLVIFRDYLPVIGTDMDHTGKTSPELTQYTEWMGHSGDPPMDASASSIAFGGRRGRFARHADDALLSHCSWSPASRGSGRSSAAAARPAPPATAGAPASACRRGRADRRPR